MKEEYIANVLFPGGAVGMALGEGQLLSLHQGFLTATWPGSYSEQDPQVTC